MDAALQEAGGHRATAAARLNITELRLKGMIFVSDALKAKWNGWRPTGPPSEAVTLSRPAIMGSLVGILKKIDATPEEIEAAMLEEDAMVRKGLEFLPLSKAEIEVAVSFQAYQKRAFANAFELLSGGIVSQYVKTVPIIGEITDQIRNLDPESKTYVAMQSILREDRAKLMAMQIQTWDRARSAMLANVKKDDSKTVAGPGKPGFGALVVKTDGDVHIHEQKPEPE